MILSATVRFCPLRLVLICKQQVSILLELAGLNRFILVSQLFLFSLFFRLDAERKENIKLKQIVYRPILIVSMASNL